MTRQINSQSFWADKDGIKLRVYRKMLPSNDQAPVLFLVHGSSLSAIPGYDLQVPSRGSQYSVMDRCALHGFDVWTMDHEGYGESERTSGTSDIAEGVHDLRAAMRVVEEVTGRPKGHFYGQSSGALRAALFAQDAPEHVEKLILDAFVWTGEGSDTLRKRREGMGDWQDSNTREITREGLLGIFTRDAPGTSEDVVAQALAEAQLSYGDTVPTGTYFDMCVNLPVVDPEAISAPALLIRGQHDGLATMEDLTSFFAALPNPDKQFVVLPGAAHISPFSLNADRLYQAIFAFLDSPGRLDPVDG